MSHMEHDAPVIIRPQSDRVCLVARDIKTGRSKSLTVYNTTPEKLLDHIRRMFSHPGEEAAAE